jgi:hypothetical protein
MTSLLHEAAAAVASALQLRVQQQRLWYCARAHCAHNQECERAAVCLPKGSVTPQNAHTCTYQFANTTSSMQFNCQSATIMPARCMDCYLLPSHSHARAHTHTHTCTHAHLHDTCRSLQAAGDRVRHSMVSTMQHQWPLTLACTSCRQGLGGGRTLWTLPLGKSCGTPPLPTPRLPRPLLCREAVCSLRPCDPTVSA